MHAHETTVYLEIFLQYKTLAETRCARTGSVVYGRVLFQVSNRFTVYDFFITLGEDCKKKKMLFKSLRIHYCNVYSPKTRTHSLFSSNMLS